MCNRDDDPTHSWDASLQKNLIHIFFRFLAFGNDISLGEEYLLKYFPPRWGAAQEKFQVHSEVLEFFLLGVLHDRFGDCIAFDADTLFVPSDRFGFFLERRDHPRE